MITHYTCPVKQQTWTLRYLPTLQSTQQMYPASGSSVMAEVLGLYLCGLLKPNFKKVVLLHFQTFDHLRLTFWKHSLHRNFLIIIENMTIIMNEIFIMCVKLVLGEYFNHHQLASLSIRFFNRTIHSTEEKNLGLDIVIRYLWDNYSCWCKNA